MTASESLPPIVGTLARWLADSPRVSEPASEAFSIDIYPLFIVVFAAPVGA